MKIFDTRVFVMLVFTITGCAKIPDVSTSYYLTKSTLRLDASRSLSCNEKGQITIAHAVSPVISNFADTTSHESFDLTNLKATFTDPNAEISFYEDGRLKSINTSQTGTAGQVIESAISVIGTIGGAVPLAENKDESETNACAYIKKHGNKANVLTLQYSADITVPKEVGQKLEAVGITGVHQSALERKGVDGLGQLTAHIHRSDLTPLKKPVEETKEGNKAGENTYDYLAARQLTKVKARVRHGQTGEIIWNGSLLMALKGNEYKIPMPKAAAFGKQEFKVAFSDSGSLSTIKYVSESGVSDAIGAADTTISGLQRPSASERAAELKAEADLIKQRERLAACRADPSNCE